MSMYKSRLNRFLDHEVMCFSLECFEMQCQHIIEFIGFQVFVTRGQRLLSFSFDNLSNMSSLSFLSSSILLLYFHSFPVILFSLVYLLCSSVLYSGESFYRNFLYSSLLFVQSSPRFVFFRRAIFSPFFSLAPPALPLLCFLYFLRKSKFPLYAFL